jgi:hypothetical protein
MFMVLPVVLVAHAWAAHAPDGPKAEELARAAALDFAKAFNARTVDQMMKVSALPFLPGRQIVGPTGFGPASPLVRTGKDLRAKLGAKVDGTLPGEVEQVAKYAAHRKQLLVSADEAKALDEAVGNDGVIMYLRQKGEKGVYPIFVRVAAGQAKVVGYLWTRPEEKGHPKK